MKRLVIWFIDTVSVLIFVVFLIVAFVVGYNGGDLVMNLGSMLGIEGYDTIHEDAQSVRVVLGLVTLIIAFIIGSLVFGFLFLLLNMNNNIQKIRQIIEQG